MNLELALTVMVWAATAAILTGIGIALYVVRKEF